MTTSAAVSTRNVNRLLAGFVLAVALGHHVGVLFEFLGEVGTTRWADWIDLGVPYAVVGLAGVLLATTNAARTPWVVLALGAIVYTQGHGIHLAANSIGNAAPGDPAHLWDEVVGHYVWYGGLAVVVGGLVLGVERRPAPTSLWWIPFAILFGFTILTNSIEGGTPVLGIGTALVFIAWGLRRRKRIAWLLVPSYGVALAGLIGWGVYWGGFPQFSELGWF